MRENFNRREFVEKIYEKSKEVAAPVAAGIIALTEVGSNSPETLKKNKLPEFILERPHNSVSEKLPRNILNKAKDARSELLKQPDPAYFVEMGSDGKEVVISDSLLNVLDLQTGKVRHVMVSSQGEVSAEAQAATESDSSDENFVQAGPDLGVGTHFALAEGKVVLAVKRAVHASTPGEYEQATYTPYSPEFDTPEIRAAGYTYLKSLLANAASSLEKDGVTSLVFHGQRVGAGINPEVLMQLVLSEQIDPAKFRGRIDKLKKEKNLNARDAEFIAMKELANEALTVIGLNEELSRKYSNSGSGATGMFQLMRGTYASLANRNKKLNPKFPEGAKDALNAAKAALMLMDSNYKNAPASEREKLKNSPEDLGLYLAACYISGSKTVNDAIASYGNKWPSNMPPNASAYIQKMRGLNRVFHPEQDNGRAVIAMQEKTKKGIVERNRNSHIVNVPEELRGSSKSLDIQNAMARREGLEFIKNPARLKALASPENGTLVPLPENDYLKVDPNLPAWRRFCLPEVRDFLINMAENCKATNPNFDAIFVTSATRDKETQSGLVAKKGNASVRSVHPTGSAFDIACNILYKPVYERDTEGNIINFKNKKTGKIEPKILRMDPVSNGMSQTQLNWFMNYLVRQEKSGKAECTIERNNSSGHVMVFNKNRIK